MDRFKKLPKEVVTAIAFKLEPEEFMRFRSVNKRTYDLLRQPKILKKVFPTALFVHRFTHRQHDLIRFGLYDQTTVTVNISAILGNQLLPHHTVTLICGNRNYFLFSLTIPHSVSLFSLFLIDINQLSARSVQCPPPLSQHGFFQQPHGNTNIVLQEDVGSPVVVHLCRYETKLYHAVWDTTRTEWTIREPILTESKNPAHPFSMAMVEGNSYTCISVLDDDTIGLSHLPFLSEEFAASLYSDDHLGWVDPLGDPWHRVSDWTVGTGGVSICCLKDSLIFDLAEPQVTVFHKALIAAPATDWSGPKILGRFRLPFGQYNLIGQGSFEQTGGSYFHVFRTHGVMGHMGEEVEFVRFLVFSYGSKIPFLQRLFSPAFAVNGSRLGNLVLTSDH